MAEHRRRRARLVAREIAAAHGPVLVVEDCDIRTWYRLWGKRLSQTTPGMLISALKVECEAAGGRLVRASTWSTALSQHCLCGERVKKTLRDREHRCIACGLAGKRDLVSAAPAAFVRFTNVDDPKTAYLDTTASRRATDRLCTSAGRSAGRVNHTEPEHLSGCWSRGSPTATPRDLCSPNRRTAEPSNPG
ncbi:transposase [Streptomyces dysideae]|uniref:transposase n=1 Tax=Streptomyces dysideae TaxID=909626 RepID=UPI000A6AEE15|nr:transposase [Streptomyces dysideae]